jgi:hypothetical protein
MPEFASVEALSDQSFLDDDVLRGTVASENQREQAGRVWVDEIDGLADSLCFYGALSKDNNGRDPIIFFEGDRLRGSGDKLKVIGGHNKWSPRRKQIEAEQYSVAFGRTFVNLARPGVFGSTGDHRQRRREREFALVNGALDKLKEAFGWSRLNLAGQSGGGHLVGMLLACRNDIEYAVIASGNVAVRQRIQDNGWSEDMTGYDLRIHPLAGPIADPIDRVSDVAKHPPRLVIMLTDPRDNIVSASVQTAYHDALKNMRLNVEQRYWYLPEDDVDHHSLGFAALLTAASLSP